LRRQAFTLVLLMAGILSFNGVAIAQPPSTRLAGLVKVCVQVVRQSPPSPPYPDYANKNFDAYYDSQSGQIFNNAQLNIDGEALYIFRKCMAEHGVSLGSK
jgi:hypothetical protein